MNKQYFYLPTEDTNPVNVPFLISPKNKIHKHCADGEFRKLMAYGCKPCHIYECQEKENYEKGDICIIKKDSVIVTIVDALKCSYFIQSIGQSDFVNSIIEKKYFHEIALCILRTSNKDLKI